MTLMIKETRIGVFSFENHFDFNYEENKDWSFKFQTPFDNYDICDTGSKDWSFQS
jgi:hypothetical protein